MNRVAVIKTGLSNIDSVSRAIEEVGGAAFVVEKPGDLCRPDRIVLPGVGSFATASGVLWSSGLAESILHQVDCSTPLLGICLGMQLLADSGDEGGTVRGLGLIPGHVRKLQPSAGERIPHIGWNEVHAEAGEELFTGIGDRTDFYFVHSYHFVPADAAHIRSVTPHCGGFASTVGRSTVLGVQFHPEKSHRCGLRLLENFLGM